MKNKTVVVTLITTVALFAASCVPKTIPDMRANGLGTQPVLSERDPQDIANCITPLFDMAGGGYLTTVRPTPTGFELVKLAGPNIWGLIVVEAAGDRTKVMGYAPPSYIRARAYCDEINAIIQQCT